MDVFGFLTVALTTFKHLIEMGITFGKKIQICSTNRNVGMVV